MLVLCSGSTAEDAQMFDFGFSLVKGPTLCELESSPMPSLVGVKNEALTAVRLGVNYMDL